MMFDKSQSLNHQLKTPYKIFQLRDLCFLYHISSGQLFSIDQDTFDFLELCLTHQINAARQILLNQGKSLKTVDAITRDVLDLSQRGLFCRENSTNTLSSNAFEAALTKRYSTYWNKLELALAENCNLACKYCYCGTCRDSPSQGLMTENIARQAITWLFAASGKSETVNITFFGGEPLLNKPVLRSAIEYSQQLAAMHGKKVYYSMTTNGTLLDDEVIGFIKRYNFGLMVSLDGPRELHNSQCPMQNGDGSFDLAVTGIKKLMKKRRSVTVRCTMTHPVPNKMELIKFFENFGFSRIVLGRTVNPVNPSPVDFTQDDYVSANQQELNEIIPWILDKLKKGETPKYFPYSRFIKKYEGNNLQPPSIFRCGACRGTTTVGADGTLFPCHRFVGMKNWKIGHIQTGPDYEKCKQFWRNYRKAIAKKCSFCWLWNNCGGPCPWEIAQSDGTFKITTRYCFDVEEHFKLASYIFVKKQRQNVENEGHDE